MRKKAISPTFTVMIVIIVAIVIIGVAVYTYEQFLAYSSRSFAVAVTSTTPKHILRYNANNKTVFITLATLSSGPTFNFNGTSFGQMIIYVPAGWNLYITYINQESGIPHNLNLVANDTPTPNNANIADDGKILLTIGASSSTYEYDGISNGKSASGIYTDIPPGIYWLCCGILGHAESGMWVVLVASNNVTVPYVVIDH